ncbi:type II secretion system F family protein [Clostridium sp. HBUAS56017]|uniref:type II secretion system F family protein n=1 Tax=Clostridium sp. HBUAS56017 TaxID=2571128 RepID=UPI00117890E7|nr:type II secretion system F family protein [Clostridium sp. HBUAS56017]
MLYLLILLAIFGGSYYIAILIQKEKKRKRKKNKNKKVESFDKINNLLRKRETGYFSYERIFIYLKKNGNPLKVSPGGFIICKFLCSIICFVVFSEEIILAILISILGFFIIDGVIYISNKQDMNKIKIQIVDVYDFLSIQTAAGVFIGLALTECYLMVKNKRLKTALAELCAEINLKKDVASALDKFGESFNSVEIDAFILTIKQSLRTGRIQQALEDLSNSQKDTNIILIQEQTNKIKISKDIIQLLMYFGIIMVIMFGLFIEVSKNWSQIF